MPCRGLWMIQVLGSSRRSCTRGMVERGVIKKGWRGLWSVVEVDGGGVCCCL
jgi:hypothetical protein